MSLALEVSGLNAGILECPVNVTIFYTDGPKASKPVNVQCISCNLSCLILIT